MYFIEEKKVNWLWTKTWWKHLVMQCRKPTKGKKLQRIIVKLEVLNGLSYIVMPILCIVNCDVCFSVIKLQENDEIMNYD